MNDDKGFEAFAKLIERMAADLEIHVGVTKDQFAEMLRELADRVAKK